MSMRRADETGVRDRAECRVLYTLHPPSYVGISNQLDRSADDQQTGIGFVSLCQVSTESALVPCHVGVWASAGGFVSGAQGFLANALWREQRRWVQGLCRARRQKQLGRSRGYVSTSTMLRPKQHADSQASVNLPPRLATYLFRHSLATCHTA